MRNQRIDILRGLGIIFVVLGHAAFPYSDWLYTFHLPIFFFISGFLRHSSQPKPWGIFLRGKVCTILVPYCMFWLFSVVIHLNLDILSTGHFTMFGIEELKGLLLGGRWLADTSYNYPIWYLQLYFIAICVYEVMVRTFSRRTRFFIGILLALLTIPFQTLVPGRPIFSINALTTALVFMIIGDLTCQWIDSEQLPKKLTDSIALGCVLLIVGAAIPQQPAVNVACILNYRYFPAACCSIMGFYIVSRLLVHSRLLRYLGESTLYILGLHTFMLKVAGKILHWICEPLGLGYSTPRDMAAAVMSIIFSCIAMEMFLWGKNLLIRQLQHKQVA